MKSISEIVSARITEPLDLEEALHLAMQLEFATIPPYLCAQWSIKHDPDRVEEILHRIVSDEMVHFALAGNLLTAIGGLPQIANENFVLAYPLNCLPGGIKQQLPVDLQPLDCHQLEVFMQIENPQFPPVALTAEEPPATIGDFYDAIIEGFQTIDPDIDQDAYAISIFGAPLIRDLDTAISALERIKSEGEGLKDSPEQPTSNDTVLAHYYAFKEVYKKRRLIKRDDKWVFEGASIILPDVYAFRKSSSRCDSKNMAFRKIFSSLLRDLEACWTEGASFDVAGMFSLKVAGLELVRSGVCPPFCWEEPISD